MAPEVDHSNYRLRTNRKNLDVAFPATAIFYIILTKVVRTTILKGWSATEVTFNKNKSIFGVLGFE